MLVGSCSAVGACPLTGSSTSRKGVMVDISETETSDRARGTCAPVSAACTIALSRSSPLNLQSSSCLRHAYRHGHDEIGRERTASCCPAGDGMRTLDRASPQPDQPTAQGLQVSIPPRWHRAMQRICSHMTCAQDPAVRDLPYLGSTLRWRSRKRVPRTGCWLLMRVHGSTRCTYTI